MTRADETGRLRVSVVAADLVVPAWIIMVLDEVASCATLELLEVIIDSPPIGVVEATEPPSFGERVLARCDEWFTRRRVALMAPADLRVWAHARGAGSVTEDGLRLALGSTDKAPAGDPDITLDLTGRSAWAASVTDASAEAWRLRGVPVGVRRSLVDPSGLTAAIMRGSQVTEFELQSRVPGRVEPEILDVGVCPTHPSSPVLTREFLAASAQQLIVERLKAAGADHGARGVNERADAARRTTNGKAKPLTGSAPRSASRPGLGTAGVFAVRTAKRRVRKAVLEKQWHLLVGNQAPDRLLPDPSRLQPLVPRAGNYWADPFVVAHDDRTHVFFEDFVYASQRGRIGVLTLDAQGRPGAEQVALELESHLSYPCVFAHEGRFYMVPETAEAGRVDLYECLDMPARWEYRRTLLSGVQLLDASLVEWGGLWWMFASLKKPAGLRTAELLVLYVSEDPVKGAWRRHPSSPLLADVTNARPAGAPFVFGDRLYRLAQVSAGSYGRGIALNEVVSLSPDHYSERRLATVRPDWAWGICGTHTLNRSGDAVVMDACRYVLRDPRRPRAESMLP